MFKARTRQIAYLLLIAAILSFGLLSPLMAQEVGAITCNSWQSRGPDRAGYTFERGTGYGAIPGHAYVAFWEPLPSGNYISGGAYQYWKSENGYAYFLVSGWPWGYRVNWYSRCVDPVWYG